MANLVDLVEEVAQVGEGFRPTDHELVNHFLKLMVLGDHHHVCKIPMIDVYKYEPWDLPYQSRLSLSNNKWYFFCRLHLLNGGRVKRLTKLGYWKLTGKSRIVRHETSKKEIGLKRILVFYIGRTPSGVATNWIMHQYSATLDLPNQGAIVLCKLIKRADKEAIVQTDYSNKMSNNLAMDFEDPDVGSDLPINAEGGHKSNSGCVSNNLDEGGSVFCMAFDSRNQTLHQQTDNSTDCPKIPELEIPTLNKSILEELDAEILQHLGSPFDFNEQKFSSLSSETDSDVQLFFDNGCETILDFPSDDDLFSSFMAYELENQFQQKTDQITYAEGEKCGQMICTSENEMANVTKTKEVG